MLSSHLEVVLFLGQQQQAEVLLSDAALCWTDSGTAPAKPAVYMIHANIFLMK